MKKSNKSITLIVVILCLATLAVAWTSNWFSNWNMPDWSAKWQALFNTEQPKDDPGDKPNPDIPDKGNIVAYDNKGNPIYAGQTVPITNGLAFATAGAESSVEIQAIISPITAFNKDCTWAIAWTDASESLILNDYFAIKVNDTDSSKCTITCKQGILNKTATLTVTTVDGGKTDTCIISFLGTPTQIRVKNIFDTQLDEEINRTKIIDEKDCYVIKISNDIDHPTSVLVNFLYNNAFDLVDKNLYAEDDYNGSITVTGYGNYTIVQKDKPSGLGIGYGDQFTETSHSFADLIKNNQNIEDMEGLANNSIRFSMPPFDYTKSLERVTEIRGLNNCYFGITVTGSKTKLSTTVYFCIEISVSGVDINDTKI